MLKLVVGVLGLLVTAGCEETAPIGPDPDMTTSSSGNSMGGAPGGGSESGSRLKARSLVGADGSRSPDGFHDEELDVTCWFRPASDGEVRCLPLTAPTTLFSDPLCSQKVIAIRCGQTPVSYAENTESDCASGGVLYRVGKSISPTSLYAGEAPNCTPQDPDSNFDYFAVDDAATPASAFVAASVEIAE